jgi:hypothetical protein
MKALDRAGKIINQNIRELWKSNFRLFVQTDLFGM